ncbi:capsular biosynthesis protein [Pusillimonas sp. NJUB218]|nr:capsular biosynthesis protein [Pusillimonas sp. NJUB218]
MPSPIDMQTPRTVALFDLNIQAVKFDAACDMLAYEAENKGTSACVIVTPNVDHIVRLERRPDLKALYKQADYIFADGMPIVWASRLLKHPLPERVTGADLLVSMCEAAVEKQWKVALLGGRPGSENELLAHFQHTFPGLDIEIIAPSMQFDPLGPEGARAAQHIAAREPNLIFVCLGLPKQEIWALHYASQLPGGVLMCVGAAMEFALGLKPRAPLVFQKAGFEWLWRLISDPKHLWRRYLVDDPYFLAICWKEWRCQRAKNRNVDT